MTFQTTDVTTHTVDSNGVKLRCLSAGEGPLVVLLHGFPDYERTWRAQLPALAERFHVVAPTLRGYEGSDAPEGVESYAMEVLVDDVLAVIAHFEAERAIVIGHDWGGAIAQVIAGVRPDVVDRLILMNIPHLGVFNKFAPTSEDQRERSKYVLQYLEPNAADIVDLDYMVRNIRDRSERAEIAEVMRRSSMEAMLNYYKANYPQPDAEDTGEFPAVRIQVPTLIFWGLDDPYISPAALNDNPSYFDAELTVVTLPGAGHWVHRDAADLVTRRLLSWLGDPEPWTPAR